MTDFFETPSFNIKHRRVIFLWIYGGKWHRFSPTMLLNKFYLSKFINLEAKGCFLFFISLDTWTSKMIVLGEILFLCNRWLVSYSILTHRKIKFFCFSSYKGPNHKFPVLWHNYIPETPNSNMITLWMKTNIGMGVWWCIERVNLSP